MDFVQINTKLDLQRHELTMLKHLRINHGPLNREAREASGMANRSALAVFSNSNGHESRQARKSKAQRGSVNAPRNESGQKPHKGSLQDAESWIVKTTETIKITPRVKQIVVGKIELPKRQVSPDLVCGEPAPTSLRGIASGTWTRHSRIKTARQRQVASRSSQLADDQLTGEHTRDRVPVMIVNFSHEVIGLPKASVIGVEEETYESLVAAINDTEPLNSKCSRETSRGENKIKTDPVFRQYLNGNFEHLTREERSVMEPLLMKYRQSFIRRAVMILRAPLNIGL